MDDLAKEVLLHWQDIPLGAKWAGTFCLIVVALYREWFVLGITFHRCMLEKEQCEHDTQAKMLAEAAAAESKITRLEAQLDELRARDGRRR